MSIVSLLIELSGETIHMIMLNASHVGALLFHICAWLKANRK